MSNKKKILNCKNIFTLIISFILLLQFILIIPITNGHDIIPIDQGEHIIAAYREYGNGRCIFYSDFETFNNRGFGIDWRNNKEKYIEEIENAKQLTLNILSWLGKGGKNLLIDQMHAESKPTDTGAFGITEFTNFLINSGYTINYTTGGSELINDIMNNYDVLLLMSVYNVGTPEETLENYSYSQKEISNITNYVSSGGGLFVVGYGENVGTGAINDIYNPLLKSFNAKFNSDVIDINSNTIRSNLKFIDHEINNNINFLHLMYPCSLSINEPTKPLINLTFDIQITPDENDKKDEKQKNDGFISSFDLSIIIIAVIIILIGINKKEKF